MSQTKEKGDIHRLFEEEIETILMRVIRDEYAVSELNMLADMLVPDVHENLRNEEEERCCDILRRLLARDERLSKSAISELARWIGIEHDTHLQWLIITNPSSSSTAIRRIVVMTNDKKIKQVGCMILMCRTGEEEHD